MLLGNWKSKGVEQIKKTYLEILAALDHAEASTRTHKEIKYDTNQTAHCVTKERQGRVKSVTCRLGVSLKLLVSSLEVMFSSVFVSLCVT